MFSVVRKFCCLVFGVFLVCYVLFCLVALVGLVLMLLLNLMWYFDAVCLDLLVFDCVY